MPALPPLSEWETFYVIVGSSGAALTGLMFVVIALAADRKRLQEGGSVSAFGTPTIMHFGMVLLVSCLATIPRRTVLTLSLSISACALGGLIFTIVGIVRMKRQTGYTPVMEDWVWHAILPVAAYSALTLAGLLLWWSPHLALHLIASMALSLLFIGMHNAWDAAVYIAMGEPAP
jgi:hypothetical protein